MADIYQALWNSDVNGCSVSGRDASGNWVDPDADVRIDPQVRASGRRERDLATRPLFDRVQEERFDQPTYQAFIRLLDNYIVNYRCSEEETPAEREEIDAFLAAILDTQPMALAYEYITRTLRRRLDPARFAATLYPLWFETYTNHFERRSVHHASGFEHVFVGEGKLNERRGAGETLGEIDGYHNWIKFYLDESRRRVNYQGYCYDVSGGVTPRSPNIVTVQMTWNHMDLQGNVLARLFHPKGGFFVGSSPELEFAMGTVAFYEALQGMAVNEKRRTTINGTVLNLVIYRSTLASGARGNQIRSFYPKFVGNDPAAPPLPDPGVTVVDPLPEHSENPGPLVIAAALPNPPGEDAGREWVEVRNGTSAALSLDEWDLRDKTGRSHRLSGSLPSGETRRVMLPDQAGLGMQLGNRSGEIWLFRDGVRVARVKYDRALPGEVIEFGAGVSNKSEPFA